MKKIRFSSIVLPLVVLLLNIGIAAAGNNTAPGNNDGNTEKSNDPNESKTVNTNKLSLNGKDWVIIEVIEESTPAPKVETQVVVEKKNISQLSFTKFEVRSCQKNATPAELMPILKEIQQGNGTRKVYMTEENGKKIWYISPEVNDQKSSPPAELNVPMLWQIKI